MLGEKTGKTYWAVSYSIMAVEFEVFFWFQGIVACVIIVVGVNSFRYICEDLLYTKHSVCVQTRGVGSRVT